MVINYSKIYLLMNNMDNRDNRVQQLTKVQYEALELFRAKNADYGDAFAKYGPIGVLVRLGDKISRLQSITSLGINLIESEKIRDTLIDLHNYAAMAIMLIDEKESREDVQDTREDVQDTREDFNDNLRLQTYLDENTTLVDRTISDDELVARILRDEVVRFRSPSPVSINASFDKNP